MQARKGRNGGKKWVRPVVFLLIIRAVTVVAVVWRRTEVEAAIIQAQFHNTALAKRRDISSEPSPLGTPEAKDTYNITSMVKGEVLLAGFEEGDRVEKGQMLYEIDKSSMKSQLTSPVNSPTRSQFSYEDALEDYNDVLNDYSGNTYKVADIGYIRELYVSIGDKMSGSIELIDVYNDDIMGIRVPFLSGEAAVIGADTPVAATLTGTGEQVAGMVKVVANQETVLMDGRLVRVVIIQMPNPGGLIIFLRVTAQIGELIGSESGVFEVSVDTTMNMDPSTSAEVESLLVNVGDYATKGTPVSRMTDKSMDKLVQSYRDVPDKTEENVESTQNKLDGIWGSYDNYAIKAPISDQIIIENFKVGDNITKNSSSATVLATIYDLSSLISKMPINELGIKRVKVGQEVEASVDVLEGQTLSGTVINVSLESTYSNGASTYPVIVTLGDMGDLLPDMNVDGAIMLEEASDVLAIPADALVRGSQVYVKDDTMTEQQGPVPIRFRATKAGIGSTGDTFVEIKNDLSEGDVIYVAESSENSSSVMMTMDGGMGGSPEGDGSMEGENRGGSEGGRQNR